MAPSGSADARTITPAARIGATSRPSNGVYHIWARRSDAHLTRLELDSDDDAYAIWADQMPLGTPAAVKPAGVDGISWTNAGGQEEEHVAFVGEDNKIYDWRLINGAISFAQYLSVPAPGGEVLTGQIAIGRRHSVHVAITAPVGGADQVTNVERGWFSHGSHYNAN